MASISEVFDEKYPELSKQLDELGVKDTETLVERFKSNGKYLNEVLDYDLKDNEKIRSSAEEESDEVVQKEVSDNLIKKGAAYYLKLFAYVCLSFTFFIFLYFYFKGVLDDFYAPSSQSSSAQSSKNITFNEAKSFMRSTCKNIGQTLLDGKTMKVDGYDVYIFLHGRGGKYCISMINTFVLEVKAVDCGGKEKQRQYWNL
jgi:hypothetical protein